MDEFNNDRNPFDEQNSSQGEPYAQQEQQNPNPYVQQTPPNGDPYNQQPQQGANPYAQGNPYNSQPQQNPYNQYNQQGGGYYGQQNIPRQGYDMPYQQMYMQKPSTGMATASMVLGIISIVLCLPAMAVPVFGIIPVIGLILGIVYKSKRLPVGKEVPNDGTVTRPCMEYLIKVGVGKGFSTAGIITSIIGIVLPILLLVVILAIVFGNPEFMRESLNELKQTNPEMYQEYYDQFSGTFPQWFESVMFFIFK